VAAGQRRKSLQRSAQADANNIKSSETLTEFVVTINPNEALEARDWLFPSIHAL
jgi:hypothetical protein